MGEPDRDQFKGMARTCGSPWLGRGGEQLPKIPFVNLATPGWSGRGAQSPWVRPPRCHRIMCGAIGDAAGRPMWYNKAEDVTLRGAPCGRGERAGNMKRHWTERLESELRAQQHLTPYEGSAEELEELIPQTVRPRDYRREDVLIDDAVPWPLEVEISARH